MKAKCLYCYEPVENASGFHEKCSLAFFGATIPPAIPYSLNDMDELAKEVVQRSVTVPGVQPKLSMSLVKATTKQPETCLTVVGALGGQFILKPPSDRFPEMPANEHLTMRMAETLGIRVVPSTLIHLSSGELAYITKRIDRTADGEKIHMLDMFQITEAFDKYKGSMEKIGKALDNYSNNTLLDKTYLFDLVLFSFLTGNNDMHLKNFSMIESNIGWELSPAYDLLNVTILLPEDKEELALSLGGKKRKLKREHFITFAKGLDLTEKQINSAFSRIRRNKSKLFHWIEKSFLSKEMQSVYKDLFENRLNRLGLDE
jgi:serine/threonine-protein kinase HipA